MISLLRAELRKIYSIRSTYVILLLSTILIALVAFYGLGIKASSNALSDPNYVANRAAFIAIFTSLFIAFIGIFSVTHEYRYNTILYSLTLTKSRITLLAAKLGAVSVFVIGFAVLTSVLSMIGMYLGAHLAGNGISAQTIDIVEVFGSIAFYTWALAMYGVVIALLLRSQVAAIATFLVSQTILEQLAGLLLKDNQIYLPFAALGAVLTDVKDLSHGTAALVALGYIVGGLVVSAVLLRWRDAN